MFRMVSSLLGYTGNIFIQRCLINRLKCFIFILCLFMCVYAPVCGYGYICAGVCAHARVRRGCPVSSLTLYSSLGVRVSPWTCGLLSAGLEPASSSNPPISSHLRAEAPSFWGDLLSCYMSLGIHTPVLMISEQALLTPKPPLQHSQGFSIQTSWQSKLTSCLDVA